MKKTNYLKLLWCIFYVLLGSISCWATAESLSLTWPSVPLLTCYCIAIGFYLIASIGAIMVTNAVKKTKPIQHRGLRLSYGVAILLLFWILISFPTNTHTFFRHEIAHVLSEEQQTSGSHLKYI